MVRVKKGTMCIDPGPVDAQTVIFLIIWKAQRFGVVPWVDPLLRSGGW